MALAASILAVGSCGGGVAGPRVGEPAPAITGTTLDGGTASLAELRGRPVIVNFWGPSCVPCRDEFPLLKQLLERHADAGLAVLGVLYLDDAASARAFASDYGATWPTVIDPNERLAGAYRIAARPESFFVDRTGVLRAIQVGQLTEAGVEAQLEPLLAPGAQ